MIRTRQARGPDNRSWFNECWRAVFLLLGFAMLSLGVIGAFLPVMPTTIFLILAAWCFGRSSPRLEAWLLGHSRFGHMLRVWRDYGAVPCRAKLMACAGMTLGYVLFWIKAQPALPLALLVAVFMTGSALYVVSRPKPPEGSMR